MFALLLLIRPHYTIWEPGTGYLLRGSEVHLLAVRYARCHRGRYISRMVVNLARQELCIKPSCLCTLMKSGIPKKHMQAFWEILSYTEINDLYKALLPTNSGVLSLLEANEELRPQEDAFFYYLRDFIRGLREDELSLFLWFVTRQDILPQQQIRVMFNRLEGIFRNCPGTVSLLKNYPAVFTRIQGYPVRPGKLRNRLCLRASRTITKIFRWQRRRQRKGYYSKDFMPWIRKRFHAQVPLFNVFSCTLD